MGSGPSRKMEGISSGGDGARWGTGGVAIRKVGVGVRSSHFSPDSISAVSSIPRTERISRCCWDCGEEACLANAIAAAALCCIICEDSCWAKRISSGGTRTGVWLVVDSLVVVVVDGLRCWFCCRGVATWTTWHTDKEWDKQEKERIRIRIVEWQTFSFLRKW